MLGIMELRHLRYFAAVAALENVSEAAQRLHVSQPAVSRQLRDLEEELGFSLFERGTHSIRLTAAGRKFQKETEAILQRIEMGIQAARSVAMVESSELSIGYAMSPSVRILPPALRTFQARRPKVRVKLHDLSTEEMLTGLRNGKLALVFLVRARISRVRGISYQDLAKLRMRLAVAPNHPLAHRSEVRLNEIVREPLIAFTQADYPDYHDWLNATFARSQNRPRITAEYDSVASLIASVEAGAGVALVTDSLACIAGPRLTLLDLLPEPKPLILSAAWPDGALSDDAAYFLRCAQESAAVESAVSEKVISAD